MLKSTIFENDAANLKILNKENVCHFCNNNNNNNNKCYTHNPSPVLENDTHKLLWDFNIETDHLIPARTLDFIIIN